MLDICSNQDFGIDFVANAKKWSLFAVEKLFDCNLLNLHLGSDVISRSESLKYLVLSFKAGKTLTVDVKQR